MAENDLTPPRVRDWCHLHTYLVWAYRGRPMAFSAHSSFSSLTAWRINSGQVKVVRKGEELCATTGEWILLPSHAGRHDFSNDAQITSIRCNAVWPDGRRLFDLDRPLRCDAANFPNLDQAADLLLNYVNDHFSAHGSNKLPDEPVNTLTYLGLNRHTAYWLESYAGTLATLGHQPSRSGPLDHRVRRILDTLSTLRLDRQPDWAALATAAGLSRKQLERIFIQHVGVTLNRYIDSRRLEYAKNALESMSSPVKEIAYQIGFKQTASFSHWFRQRSGMSALQYRKSNSHNISSDSPNPLPSSTTGPPTI